MKLYTEEQMIEAIELAREKYPPDITLTTKGIMHQFTPIELPSDEDIERNMNLLLRWVLKHYETHTDENGMFCWVSPNGYEFDCIDVVKDYINQNK